MRNVGHICDERNDKYCGEGANPGRHDHSLPADHESQHGSHNGGCICIYWYQEMEAKTPHSPYAIEAMCVTENFDSDPINPHTKGVVVGKDEEAPFCPYCELQFRVAN